MFRLIQLGDFGVSGRKACLEMELLEKGVTLRWFTLDLIKREKNIKEAIGDTLGIRPHSYLLAIGFHCVRRVYLKLRREKKISKSEKSIKESKMRILLGHSII